MDPEWRKWLCVWMYVSFWKKNYMQHDNCILLVTKIPYRYTLSPNLSNFLFQGQRLTKFLEGLQHLPSGNKILDRTKKSLGSIKLKWQLAISFWYPLVIEVTYAVISNLIGAIRRLFLKKILILKRKFFLQGVVCIFKF